MKIMENNSNPLVSILIPLYNQEKYFGACKRSVCNQTYKNLEIIIVNDGSTDKSPRMAHDWAAKDKRVKVIDKQNEGLAFARRDGLLNATGEFVMFLDSDDSLTRHSVEAMVFSALNSGADLVVGSWNKVLGFLKRRRADSNYSFPVNQLITQPELFDKYYLGFFKNDILPVSMCARLYRKNVIDHALQETSLYDKEITLMGEDQFFNVKLFPYLHSVYRIDKTVYIYRFGGGTTYFNPRFTQLFTLSDKRLKLLDQYNYNEGYGYLFDEYVACLFYHASRLIFCNVTDKDGVIDFFKKEINHRELMPRLVEYYTEKGIKNQQVQSLINRDYEGMYKCALDLVEQRKRSLKMRIRSYAITVLSQWS